MSEHMISIKNLSKAFDGKVVLKDINAVVNPGEVIGLLGLNGAGKTTLLETLLGFCIPDQGSSEIFGKSSAHTMDVQTKLRIGFVPQSDELVDTIKGRQYLDLIAAFYPQWNHELVKRLTDEWSVPLEQKINKLSVGQRQKLSILSALGHEPDLLVLDEPVASLDPLARRQFLKELINISASQQRSILFSTHIVSDLERIASRVWVMKDGTIEIDTQLDDIKESYVRVHLPLGQDLPANFDLGGLISQRSEQQSKIAIFSNWSSQQQESLQANYASKLTIETLSLEDIFLEIHA